ncbi:hypothetical protein ACJ73_02381 [Blastomyces percursus]|uniref:AAA+ ATPase domain-containing protein n=1 Tax=Blastomyces percursus TaxID=1658174 RepID=A0A1J9RF23_9EURO|nr:hypothetical protein ACJ73_02381 [Blastomyces percursus]
MADSNDVNNIKTVQLSSSKDWKLWYAFILEAAKHAEVGDFVDLKKPDRAQDLKKPVMPVSTNYTAEGKIKWDMEMTVWKVELAEYERIKRAIERMNNLIRRTVSAEELKHCPSGVNVDVKDVIRPLEARLSPTVSSLRHDVRTRYTALCKPPKNQGIDKWLNEWSLIENDVMEAGIDGAFDLKIDFFNENTTIDAGYAQAWAKDVRRNENVIYFTSLINDFRERLISMPHSQLLTDDRQADLRTGNVSAEAGTNGRNVTISIPRFVRTIGRRERTEDRRQMKLDVLREIVRDVRAISLREDKPSYQIERNFLYNFLPDLEKYITEKGWDHADPCSKHVDLLIRYIKETYASTTQSLSPLLKKGEITYDLLWTIFKPGIFIYSTCLGTGKPRCVTFDAGEEKMKMSGIKYFSLDCRYLDFDGEVFGEVSTQLEVVRFHGPRRIHTLDAFPLDHHPNISDVMGSLIDCGRKFCHLNGQHIRHCRGRAFFKVRGEIVRTCINSRVVIDPVFFLQMNPNYTRPRINQRNEYYVDHEGVTHLDVSAVLDNKDQRMREQVKSNGVNPSEMKDVDFLICCPTVLGYSFNDNLWMEFAVTDLGPVEWSSTPFKNLKIPSLQRDTLLALAKTRLGLVPSVPFDDFVTGKGRGLNILLYGRPGLGKTFTAEALAEHLQRPLYRVAAGELIGDRCLEDHVSNIFKAASHFNAILLVDEADVFLQGRSVGGVHDHSVTVFLRKLEYFEGILFLTTNRVDEFDNAILSRIHYKLKYEDLGREFRRDVSNNELHKLEGLDLSARDIKNLAMIAHALATFRGERVSYTHLEQAAASNEEFARAFNHTGPLETMYN